MNRLSPKIKTLLRGLHKAQTDFMLQPEAQGVKMFGLGCSCENRPSAVLSERKRSRSPGCVLLLSYAVLHERIITVRVRTGVFDRVEESGVAQHPRIAFLFEHLLHAFA